MNKRVLITFMAFGVLVLSACSAAKPAVAAPSTAPSPTAAPSPSPTVAPEPADTDFVKIADYLPEAFIELKYATTDNFTGAVIYDFSDAYLRYGTVKRLRTACDALLQQGYSIKIWDAYRPLAAQRALWAVCPDANFVSNPDTGTCAHCCGDAVDITLVLADGTELEMPTGFDDFSAKADRDYTDLPENAAENARILESAMLGAGFIPYRAEWWHYSDPDDYPKETEFIPE